jgi:hypothetical protein
VWGYDVVFGCGSKKGGIVICDSVRRTDSSLPGLWNICWLGGHCRMLWRWRLGYTIEHSCRAWSTVFWTFRRIQSDHSITSKLVGIVTLWRYVVPWYCRLSIHCGVYRMVGGDHCVALNCCRISIGLNPLWILNIVYCCQTLYYYCVVPSFDYWFGDVRYHSLFIGYDWSVLLVVICSLMVWVLNYGRWWYSDVNSFPDKKTHLLRHMFMWCCRFAHVRVSFSCRSLFVCQCRSLVVAIGGGCIVYLQTATERMTILCVIIHGVFLVVIPSRQPLTLWRLFSWSIV